jgi:hypothetical protein
VKVVAFKQQCSFIESGLEGNLDAMKDVLFSLSKLFSRQIQKGSMGSGGPHPEEMRSSIAAIPEISWLYTSWQAVWQAEFDEALQHPPPQKIEENHFSDFRNQMFSSKTRKVTLERSPSKGLSLKVTHHREGKVSIRSNGDVDLTFQWMLWSFAQAPDTVNNL